MEPAWPTRGVPSLPTCVSEFTLSESIDSGRQMVSPSEDFAVGGGFHALTTGVTGFGELQSKMSDWDPRSSFVMEPAWPTWGIPSLPTCVPVLILSESIDSGGRLISLGGDLTVGSL